VKALSSPATHSEPPPASELPGSARLKHVLQTLKSGVAVADPGDGSIVYENARFFEWFPATGEAEDRLTDRLQDLDMERARGRIERGRPYSYETEVRAGARTLSILVELRQETLEDQTFLMVECQNVSKQKEAEYMLDSYSRMAEKNARELQREKERVEKLLLNIMPRTVYEEMKDLGTATPQRFDAASVLMLDFVDFTNMAISRDPSALIAELNDIFSAFDRIVELFECERIKTIGDAYLAVSGLPEVNTDHAANIAKVALRMRRYLARRNASHPTQWNCRIGVATGPVIGSLVGIQKYVYDVFGPAPNLAARLEAFSEPMQITLCEETYKRMGDEFRVSELGEVEIKGFGKQTLYTLEGQTGSQV
jgi:class 3 adenylate cyclase